MSWTFFKEIELYIFFWEEFKVEILPDIGVSFLRPNYGNNENILWKSVHICKLFC